MNRTKRLSLRPVLAALLLGSLCASPAWAAAKGASSEMAARYQQERAACMAKAEGYDRSVCLQDATAAYAEEKRRGLRKVPDADFQANQLRRCEALPGKYRQDCIARMNGAGTAIGSVDSGGIYRELVTIEVGEAPAPKSTSPVTMPPEPAGKN
jgi:hypothetical protein